jgi:hypothetical protein
MYWRTSAQKSALSNSFRPVPARLDNPLVEQHVIVRVGRCATVVYQILESDRDALTDGWLACAPRALADRYAQDHPTRPSPTL